MAYRTLNPFTEQLVEDYPEHTDDAVEAALAKADGLFHSDWSKGDIQPRLAVLKSLSGLLTELPATLRSPDLAFQALKPVVDLVIDLFGPSRLMWGSDWPVLTLVADHAAWGALTDRLLDDLNEAERTAILGNILPSPAAACLFS